LFLSSSAFFAIRNAVASARKDNSLSGYFRFDSPATAERIRMACGDSLTVQVGFASKRLKIFLSFSSATLQEIRTLKRSTPITFKLHYVLCVQHNLHTSEAEDEKLTPWAVRA